MDVNSVQNNIKSVELYTASNDVSQYSNNIENKDIEHSNIKAVEKSLENQNNQEKRNETSKKQLDKAVMKLNKFLEDDRTHAEYSVHKELGTTMIKIIDDDTKEVILELPPKKILDMVASMCEQVGLIDKKA